MLQADKPGSVVLRTKRLIIYLALLLLTGSIGLPADTDEQPY